jgi:hypothetical protein
MNLIVLKNNSHCIGDISERECSLDYKLVELCIST